jgi:hypothetical protein
VPQATIESAKQVIADGRPDRLGEFLYADSPDMRRLMDDAGILLGHLSDLGEAVQARFPEEVAALKAQAASGKTPSLFTQMTSQIRGGAAARRPPNPAQGDQMRAAFDMALKQLFSDPYGWLREAEGRLSTEEVDDETVALLWDGKPLFAPLGLTMRLDSRDEQWYFVLPTGAPGVSRFMPKTPEQFEIFGSVLATFDNVVVDLTTDVKAGRITSLDRLGQVAGEKTFIPAVMTLYAYSRAVETQRKEAAGSPTTGG